MSSNSCAVLFKDMLEHLLHCSSVSIYVSKVTDRKVSRSIKWFTYDVSRHQQNGTLERKVS